MKKGIIIGSLAILLLIIGFYNYTQTKMSVSDTIEEAVVNYLDQGLEAHFSIKKRLKNLIILKKSLRRETLHTIELKPFNQITNQKFTSCSSLNQINKKKKVLSCI